MKKPVPNFAANVRRRKGAQLASPPVPKTKCARTESAKIRLALTCKYLNFLSKLLQMLMPNYFCSARRKAVTRLNARSAKTASAKVHAKKGKSAKTGNVNRKR